MFATFAERKATFIFESMLRQSVDLKWDKLPARQVSKKQRVSMPRRQAGSLPHEEFAGRANGTAAMLRWRFNIAAANQKTDDTPMGRN